MNSLERLVGILDLFEEGEGVLSAEQLHQQLGYTRSTLYRYLKVLTDAGLLTSLHSVGYTLGPRITELDFRIRARDPLIAASKPVMLGLTQEFTGIALLCRRYRDKVLCVHQEASTDAFISNYERGRGRPLTRGAAARVILAHFAAPQVRKLYERQPEEFLAAGIGATLAEVRTRLRRIRERGFEATSSEVTPGVTGISAPILDSGGVVLGSLSLTIGQVGLSDARIHFIAEKIVKAAAFVGSAIRG